MNLRDLRYLVAVAEHRHFGRAAQACFVSQPTLSAQLKKLETTLGVTLVERTNRQVMLSPAGEKIVDQAATILHEVDALTAIAEQFGDPRGGDFRLGIIPTIAPYLLPKILEPIRKAFPTLRLQLTEGQTAHVTQALKQGSLDAVLLALPLNEDNVHEHWLYDEPFYFAVSKQHPAARKKTVSVDDLQGEEVLLLEDGHCLRDQALDVCNAHSARENLNFSATSLETLRQMVAADVGVTLMPQLAVPARDGNVSYVPFSGQPPSRSVGLCWRTTTTRSELLADLTQVLAATVDPSLKPNR